MTADKTLISGSHSVSVIKYRIGTAQKTYGSVYIGADIGSSFVKLAVMSDGCITEVKKLCTPRIDTGNRWEYEYDIEAVYAFITDYIDSMSQKYDVAGVIFSTQMHGFLLGRNGIVTNYISWQDERSLRPGKDGKSAFQRLKEKIPPEEIRKGGVNIKCELSLCGAVAYFEQNSLTPSDYELFTLGSYMLYRMTGRNITHITNAAPTGMYDIYADEWNREVIRLGGLDGIKLPEVTDKITICGYYNGIPVYPDIGDHQATVLGSGIEEGILNINIGTASQMSMICSSEHLTDGEKSEVRPFFDGKYIRTVSKLPGGRSLQVIVDMFSDVITAFTGVTLPDSEIWKVIDGFDTASPTDLDVKLGFFPSLLFKEGEITNINSENLTSVNLMRGAYYDMSRSFLKAAGEFGTAHIKQARVCGKFAPFISEILNKLDRVSGIEYVPVKNNEAVFSGLFQLMPKETELKRECI